MKLKAPPAGVDLMFRAFSDRTRLRILALLRAGETCVCDLQSVLDVPQPKVSRHLAYLRKAGLVRVRKKGLWSYYTLAPARNAFHAKLLDCLVCCFKDVPELVGDAARIRGARRLSSCCAG
jgi:ArsR family transcriptional regulator